VLMLFQRGYIAIVFAALIAQYASAAEAVRHIGVHVQPYYEAARTPDGKPRVAVGQTYDGLLSSNRKEDILAAKERVESDPRVVTPMTMMVLAIRLYDVGLRDDAVFWFYAAKARYTTLEDVIDIRMSGLIAPGEAVKSFAMLAGPFINGYAFCDRAKQHAASLNAIEWAEKNPYSVLFMSRLTANESDRQARLKRSIAEQKAFADREHASFNDPKFAEAYALTRRRSQADEKFCWK
jgi:hypothetical protein